MNWDEVDALFARGRSEPAAAREALLATVGSEEAAQVRQLWTTDDEAGAARAARLIARADSPTHHPGQVVGNRFRLVALLGSGGMGEVFSARDETLGRLVALKFVRPGLTASEHVRTRLAREARALCSLTHPHVCTLYDVVWDHAEPVLVMELLQGETLASRLTRGPLSQQELLQVALEALQGLAAAHRAGVVHRDLKPANVMLTPTGVKLFDFGIASHRPTNGTSSATTATRDVGIVGSAPYMSPEQLNGQPVDARSDIFAFGCVLYEMVTGRRAFARETQLSTVAAVLEREPAPVASIVPNTPAGLTHAINTCLRKNPDERYQHAEDLQDALRRLRFPDALEEAAGGTSLSWAVPRPRSLLMAALVAIVALGVAWPLWRAPAARPAAEPAITPPDSVAVLPFEMPTRNADLDYIADGLAESVTNALSRVSGIRVAARSRAFSYKGKNVTVQEIGQALNVRTVVTGRVTRAGERLRIQADLIDIESGTQLWGQQYVGSENDLLRIQTELSQALRQRLASNVSEVAIAGTQAGSTTDPKAYQLNLRGRHAMFTLLDFEEAIPLLKEAVAVDPTYALAYAGLAESYARVSGSPLWPPLDTMPKAKAAALRALEIDPTLVDGRRALGTIRGWYDFDWGEAEKELTRAVELDPNDALANLYYGWLLMHTGHADAAVARGRTAYELDPLTPIVELGFGQMYYACNQPQIAIERLKRLAQASPDFMPGRFFLAYSYLIANQYRDAARELDELRRLYPEDNSVLVLEAFTLGKLGKSGPARSLLPQLQQKAKSGYMSPYLYAMANVAAGRTEDAIKWLQRAHDERDGNVHGLGVDPVFAHLRSDPRVRAVNISKAGLSTCQP